MPMMKREPQVECRTRQNLARSWFSAAMALEMDSAFQNLSAALGQPRGVSALRYEEFGYVETPGVAWRNLVVPEMLSENA